MLARAMPKITTRINVLIFKEKSSKKSSRQNEKGYGASYNQTGICREGALS
jgi:hypothetical protein